ncbi:MAG: hypothetical protein M1826_005481 [Phylliscum demangeonii]|nr:MAG: hypothetical protein M1826_005481 [Phylliscum demangeonii]
MSPDVDRIPEVAFKAVSGIMAGLAISAAVVRTVHRLRSHRRLFVDDLFLFIACVFLAAGTILLFLASTDLYLSTSNWILSLATDFQEVLKSGVRLQLRAFAYACMTWTAIYAVKLSFLFFFRVLVERIRYMTIYWRIVLGATMVAFGVCVCEAAMECPYFDAESLHCAFGSGLTRTVTITAVAIVLDFLTDLMIITLPIHLLWKVRMKARQKLGLGVFLCLSVFMMMTAVVRISALHRRLVVLGMPLTAIDFTWKLFWQQVEACLAVLMVSLTALRSIFVTDHYRGGGGRRHARPRSSRLKMSPGASYRPRYWPRHKHYASSSDDGTTPDPDPGSLPAIPSATLTGLRTFIRGGGGRGRPTAARSTNITLQSDFYQEETIVASEQAPVPVPQPVSACALPPRRHELGGEEV